MVFRITLIVLLALVSQGQSYWRLPPKYLGEKTLEDYRYEVTTWCEDGLEDYADLCHQPLFASLLIEEYESMGASSSGGAAWFLMVGANMLYAGLNAGLAGNTLGWWQGAIGGALGYSSLIAALESKNLDAAERAHFKARFLKKIAEATPKRNCSAYWVEFPEGVNEAYGKDFDRVYHDVLEEQLSFYGSQVVKTVRGKQGLLWENALAESGFTQGIPKMEGELSEGRLCKVSPQIVTEGKKTFLEVELSSGEQFAFQKVREPFQEEKLLEGVEILSLKMQNYSETEINDFLWKKKFGKNLLRIYSGMTYTKNQIKESIAYTEMNGEVGETLRLPSQGYGGTRLGFALLNKNLLLEAGGVIPQRSGHLWVHLQYYPFKYFGIANEVDWQAHSVLEGDAVVGAYNATTLYSGFALRLGRSLSYEAMLGGFLTGTIRRVWGVQPTNAVELYGVSSAWQGPFKHRVSYDLNEHWGLRFEYVYGEEKTSVVEDVYPEGSIYPAERQLEYKNQEWSLDVFYQFPLREKQDFKGGRAFQNVQNPKKSRTVQEWAKKNQKMTKPVPVAIEEMEPTDGIDQSLSKESSEKVPDPEISFVQDSLKMERARKKLVEVERNKEREKEEARLKEEQAEKEFLENYPQRHFVFSSLSTHNVKFHEEDCMEPLSTLLEYSDMKGKGPQIEGKGWTFHGLISNNVSCSSYQSFALGAQYQWAWKYAALGLGGRYIQNRGGIGSDPVYLPLGLILFNFRLGAPVFGLRGSLNTAEAVVGAEANGYLGLYYRGTHWLAGYGIAYGEKTIGTNWSVGYRADNGMTIEFRMTSVEQGINGTGSIPKIGLGFQF